MPRRECGRRASRADTVQGILWARLQAPPDAQQRGQVREQKHKKVSREHEDQDTGPAAVHTARAERAATGDTAGLG